MMLPKLSEHIKCLDETKYMSFLIEDEDFLKEYNNIWNTLRNLMKKELDSKPVYNKKCLKTEII